MSTFEFQSKIISRHLKSKLKLPKYFGLPFSIQETEPESVLKSLHQINATAEVELQTLQNSDLRDSSNHAIADHPVLISRL